MNYDNPIVIKSRISVLFQPILEIRTKIFELEKVLSEHFLTPHLIPIPDEVAQEIPRIEFHSKNGQTVVRFSQVRLDMLTDYDENFSTMPDKCFSSIEEKVSLLTKTLELINPDIAFVGLTFTVRWPQLVESDKAMVKRLSGHFFQECIQEDDIYDFRFNRLDKYANKYFIHTSLSNYRLFVATNTLNTPYPRFSELLLKQHGLEMEIELNDRLGYENGEKSKGLATVADFIPIAKKVILRPPCLSQGEQDD